MSLTMLRILFLTVATIGLWSCDFSPPRLAEIKKAQELVRKQRYQDAIVKYEKALEKNLSQDVLVRIYYQLGDLYSIYLSEHEKAIEYYKKTKENTQAPFWLVKTQERIAEIQFSFLREYSESFLNYDQLSRFTPPLERNDFYEFRRALSLLKMGKLDRAETFFKDILVRSSHKHHVSGMYHLGIIAFRKEEWAKALGYWSEYIKREKSKDSIVQTKFLMANVYETMEDLKRAYNLYYSILGEYPNTQVVKNRLKGIYERRVARKR